MSVSNARRCQMSVLEIIRQYHQKFKIDNFLLTPLIIHVRYLQKKILNIYLVPYILPPVPFQECIHYKGIAEYGMKV